MKNLNGTKNYHFIEHSPACNERHPAEIKWIEINASYTLADHHLIFVVPKDTIQTYLVMDITILSYWQDLLSSLYIHYYIQAK
jgi:hypothetical protein